MSAPLFLSQKQNPRVQAARSTLRETLAAGVNPVFIERNFGGGGTIGQRRLLGRTAAAPRRTATGILTQQTKLQLFRRSPGAIAEARSIRETAALPRTPRQRNPLTPRFAFSGGPDSLSGLIPGLGQLSALTIGGIPGALGTQGLAGNPLAIRRARNVRT